MAIDTSKELEAIKKEYENREDKPWGYEKILINTEKYLTKELFLREGYQTSFHYHAHKDETMYIVTVQVTLNLKIARNTLERMTPSE